MLRITNSSFFGGYDGPSSITGYYTEGEETINFSGYGIYEHTWLYGEQGAWIGADARWMFFHDDLWYGIVVLTTDTKTDEILTRTGRLAIEGDPSKVYRFDDFEWQDDGKQYPTAIRIYGNYTDLQGNYVGQVDLSSSTYTYFGIWLVTDFAGVIGDALFDGFSWSEIHKPSRAPCIGDINGDGVVDIFDAIILSNAFNSVPTSPSWNPNADLNNDGKVDIYDALIFSNNWNAQSEINQGEILNYLDYNLNHRQEIGLLDFVFTLDSYDMLGIEIPNRTQTIEYLNSIQSDEGTWLTGQNHYVPITAQVLMFYNRSGVKPAKSLEPFFSTIDTWEEVVKHVQTYDSGNIWGGLWGYVTCYVVYKGESPPWTKEFLDAANSHFDTWAYDNHQRTHLIMNLFQLGASVPRINDVLNIALNQQKGDGSWDSSLPETAFMAGALQLIRNQTTVDQTLIDSAIQGSINFTEGCYRRIESGGKFYAGFASNLTEQNPNPWATGLGIYSSLNPESDVWLRWFARVHGSFVYFPEKPIVNEQIDFNASASYSPGGNVTSYEWNFNDGNTAKVTVPMMNHTYALPGNYAVTLNVTDDNNLWNMTTKTIRVYSERVYTFSVSWQGLNYTIIALSNSTVANFNFNYSLKQISFNVTGLFGTMGYCNVSIPKTFMSCDFPSQWNVSVDGSPIDDLRVTEDTNTYLFFTYGHSTHEIIVVAVNVVPEFPSVVALLSILMVVSLGYVAATRRHPRD
ncbi:MAG: PKD domain-containing protein [Candidatus Bathyarchaeia archaeon]